MKNLKMILNVVHFTDW